MFNHIKHYHSKTFKYDFINKFTFSKNKKIPQLKKICLNFGTKNPDINKLVISLVALNLITNKKGCITKAKKSNILLKIRKGDPTGCKTTLTKDSIFKFLDKILVEVFPKNKNFNSITLKKRIKKNVFSFELTNVLDFSELEKHYSAFKLLPNLTVTFITNTTSENNMSFFIKTLQLP